jgi:hypothetical protein
MPIPTCALEQSPWPAFGNAMPRSGGAAVGQGRSSRWKLKGRSVGGSHDREVVAIERRHLGEVEAFCCGDDGRVDGSER